MLDSALYTYCVSENSAHRKILDFGIRQIFLHVPTTSIHSPALNTKMFFYRKSETKVIHPSRFGSQATSKGSLLDCSQLIMISLKEFLQPLQSVYFSCQLHPSATVFNGHFLACAGSCATVSTHLQTPWMP